MISLDGLSAQLFDVLPVDLRKSILLSVAAFGIFLMLTFHELFQSQKKFTVRHKLILTMATLMFVLGISTLVFGYESREYIAVLSLVMHRCLYRDSALGKQHAVCESHTSQTERWYL